MLDAIFCVHGKSSSPIYSVNSTIQLISYLLIIGEVQLNLIASFDLCVTLAPSTPIEHTIKKVCAHASFIFVLIRSYKSIPLS